MTLAAAGGLPLRRPMMTLRLLGDFELQDLSQAAVSIATLKGRALLAYLACAKGTSVSRDSLALLLWCDSDSAKSKRNLRQVLFKLSRILARHDLPILRVDAQSVALRCENIRVDTWELDDLTGADSISALERVGALYRGEFLQGLALDAPVFGDWLADMRAHCQTRALNCLQRLLERQRAAGDFHGAVSAGLRALEMDTSQEQIHRALMEMYLAKGMRGAALNQYRACRFVLRRDLDVAPDRATEDLYRQIHECKPETQPSYRSAAGTTGSGPAGGAPQGRDWAPPEPPRGRAAELKALHELFLEACSRGARLFSISGEAGIGKTHLLDTFSRHLEKQEIVVLRVAARQAESRSALELWRQILDVLPPARGSSYPHEAGGMREAAAPYGDALERLAKGEAQGPFVVILEDIQWADNDSLQTLGRAVHRLRLAPVLFVVAARLWPEMGRARIASLSRDLKRAGLIRHCHLSPLSLDDSTVLLDEAMAARGQSPDKARQRKRLLNSAQGNPEILLAGLAPAARIDAPSLPRNLRHSARQILSRLLPGAKTLVQFASLMQAPHGVSIFARAAGLEAHAVSTELNRLAARKLLCKTGGKFAIARAWFAKAVCGRLPAHRQRRMHGAIASAIRTHGAQDLAPYYGALVYHCRAAGEECEAVGYRLSELEMSVARGARRRASKVLESLTRSLPERWRDPKINAVIWRAGFLRAAIAEADSDPESALIHLRALERRGPRNDDPRAAAALSLALSRACCLVGNAREGLGYARRSLYLAAGQSGTQGPWKLSERLLFRCYLSVPAAAEVISGLKDSAQQARRKKAWSSLGEIATAQAMMEGLSGRIAAMRSSFDNARAALARQPDSRTEASLLQIGVMAQNWTGGDSRAVEMLGRALALSRDGGDLIGACVLRGRRGQANLTQGHFEEARIDLEQAIAEARALGSIPYVPLFYSWLAEVSGRIGFRDDAVKQAHHAWRLSFHPGQTWTRAPILSILARRLALARRPNIAAAERAAREAIAIQRTMGVRVGVANAHLAYAEVRRAAGDAAGAQSLFRQAREMLRRIGIEDTAMESWALAGTK